jgi:glycerol transport system substrate-binding protein
MATGCYLGLPAVAPPIPPAVYALMRRLDEEVRWEASGMTFGKNRPSAGARPGIAQQIFWYTAFTADMTKPAGLPVRST